MIKMPPKTQEKPLLECKPNTIRDKMSGLLKMVVEKSDGWKVAPEKALCMLGHTLTYRHDRALAETFKEFGTKRLHFLPRCQK